MQPLSHNCGTDNNDELVSPGTIVAVFAVADNVAGRGRDPLRVAFKIELSGKLISMSSPFLTLVKHFLSSSLIKCDEAPLSHFAMTTFCLGRLVILCKHAVVGKQLWLLTLMLLSLTPPTFHKFRKRFGMRFTLPPFLS